MRKGSDGSRNADLIDNSQQLTLEANGPSHFVSQTTNGSQARRGGRNSSERGAVMTSWNLKQAKLALEWASTPEEKRSSIEEISREIGRSPKAILNFLRRQLPPGQRPWTERPRWRDDEAAVIAEKLTEIDGLLSRSAAAVRKYKSRKLGSISRETDLDEDIYSVAEVAGALGVSRRTVYRMLDRGHLRRWKGGVAEASFLRLVRKHPELIPYARLSREHREWLVVNGFPDPTIEVKKPSSNGLLNND